MSNVVELCRTLIQIPSLSGREEPVAKRAGELMKACGFDEVSFDKYGNITGKIHGSRPGKTLLLDAHIDTVPVSDEAMWTHPPFAAEIADGKIYGRGTSDMKGALSAMIEAGSRLAQDRDFAGTFVVAGVCHEECFEGVAAAEVARNIKPDYVIIGEATNLEIACGQKGRAEIVIEAFGKSAHSANPQKGVNAILKLNKLIAEVEALPFSTHSKMGDGVFALTDIKSAPYPGASVVPNYCRATYDRRILAGETEADVLRPFEQAAAKLQKKDADCSFKISIAGGKEICYTGEPISGKRFFPPWICDEDSDFIHAVCAGIESAGIPAKKHYYTFCTNGSYYAGTANITTAGFGPSVESMAHVCDESVTIEHLEKAADGFFGIAKALLR